LSPLRRRWAPRRHLLLLSVTEDVTYQKLGVKHLRKFRTFCLIWSAANFQPKLLALP
jgi:hypothetical protein